MEPEFIQFPKMARLSRTVTISEKIDGTNGQILITEDGDLFAGSRTRWLTPLYDNFGFARWCEGNKEELLKLGPGRHFGEWWGQGIQRGYNLKEKRFSLFNTARWHLHDAPAGIWSISWDKDKGEMVERLQQPLPACCGLVPVLYRGPFSTEKAEVVMAALEIGGSKASPGFMNPEGIVVFHEAAQIGFKKTIKDDGAPKSLANK